MAAGIDRFASAASALIEKAKKGRPAQHGMYQNGNVTVGTRSYPAKLATDVNVANGDWVWVQVTDSGSQAVIIGA